ncbi:MAG TPA: sugar phosphate isomerase/epimerase family protein [Planctomycetota bacterium]|jgi:hexulose-6-phosphate isomerase
MIDDSAISRRTALGLALASAATVATGASAAQRAFDPPQPTGKPDARKGSVKKYEMKKSINLWAFPYPGLMTLEECLRLAKDAGFDGVELNYDLESDVSVKAGTHELEAIRKIADKVGIAISGLCSFLFWPYPLSSNDEAKRSKSLELAGKMAQAAHDLGTQNLLTVPGAVTIPWRDDHEPVPNEVCDKRAKEAIAKLLPQAEKLKVRLNIENIFFSGYLMTPQELIAFVDSFGSEWVQVHFDTGNMLYECPEHWIPLLGKRIRNVHLKECNRKSPDHSLECFRTLLDGTTNWPAVMDAFDAAGYRSYLTFEYFHPLPHYPEVLIYQTSDALDRMLGKKS